jgi:hypothetical protein
MYKYLKNRNRSTQTSLEALSWDHTGKQCVHINSGQWLNPKSLYWNCPGKRFEAQMKRLKRNEKAGCENYPYLIVDYGDVIIPTMFGAQLGDIDGGPWIEHVLNDIAEVKNMRKLSLDTPVWQHFLRTLDYFMEHCPDGVRIMPPHKLSPFGNAMLLRGTNIYLDLYDNPLAVHELLKKVTEAFITCFEFIHERIGTPVQDGFSPNGFPLPGIFIGDDSSINMNNEQVWEFDLKYLEMLSKHFSAPLFCHYCVMNETQGLQLLRAYSDADFIAGLNNQYGPDFFLDNYELFFKNKLLLATETPIEKLGTDKLTRLTFFRNMLLKVRKEMKDKSGLLYFVEVADEELEDFLKILNSFQDVNTNIDNHSTVAMN